MTRRRDDERRREIARCVGTWRRLVIAFGPKAAQHVAMFVAENAYADRGSPSVLARPTQQTAVNNLRVDSSTVERRIHDLVKCGWLKRVGPRAVTGTAQCYEFTIPEAIDWPAIDEALSLRKGVWERLGQLPRVYAGQSGATAPHPKGDCPAFDKLLPRINAGPTGFNRINGSEGAPARETGAPSPPVETARASGANAPEFGVIAKAEPREPGEVARQVLDSLRQRFPSRRTDDDTAVPEHLAAGETP